MKLKNIIGLVSLFLAIFWASCYDDLGNYGYSWVPEVRVGEIPDTAIDRGTVLSLRPSLYKILDRDSSVRHEADTADYTYRWFVYIKDQENVVLCEKQNIADTIWLPIGNHIVTYEVKDKKTDLSWTAKFNLQVTGRIVHALAFLTEDEEKNVELDLYAQNAKGEKFLEKGTLARSGFPYVKGGANCVYYGRYAAGSGKNAVWIATGEATGWIDPVNLRWNPTNLARSIMAQPRPVAYTFKNIMSFGDRMFFLTEAGEGHLMNNYATIWTNFSSVGGKEIAIHPVAGGTSLGVVLYDKTNCRFVSYDCSIMTNPNAACFALPDKDALQGVKLIHMQTLTNSKVFAVVKDAGGKFWRYSWSVKWGAVGKYGGEINVPETMELKNIDMIEHAEHVVFDRKNGYIYFSIGNKLYNYRWGGGVDGCEEVIGFKTDKPICSLISQSFSPKDYNTAVFVATWDKDKKDYGGKVDILKPNDEESREVSILESISNLGQVKSIGYW